MSENKKRKRFLFIRTFRVLKGGGPVPPLGILYLASAIRKNFDDLFDVRVVDTGITDFGDAEREIREWKPDYAGLSAMSCEAGLMHDYAALVKSSCKNSFVISGGAHVTAVGAEVLRDENIDAAVFGEAEETIVDLLETIERDGSLSGVRGIAYRSGSETIETPPRPYVRDLDSLAFPAWDLVDLTAYGNHPNWNGIVRENFCAPILTSRGCSYKCYFCHNIFGRKVRMRSAGAVMSEIKILHEEFGVKEFHIVDDVFNIDARRAEEICCLIIESKLDISLAFPNGLRADIMTDNLINLLRRAGTYRIHYGFETSSPRLQKQIGKNLDIQKAVKTFEATTRAGIITGAYFMFGFPGQTRDEIIHDMDFASGSCLDAAFFFKATPYPGSPFFDSIKNDSLESEKLDYNELHFYSASRSYGELGDSELNSLILLAQQKFFLKPRRLAKNFLRSTRKGTFLKNTIEAFAIMLLGYMIGKLSKNSSGGKE